MNEETLHVTTYFEILQNSIFRSTHEDRAQHREIEFEYAGRAYSIRQDVYVETNNTGRQVEVMSTFYQKDNMYHRLDGPAVIQNENQPNENRNCNFLWAINGKTYTKEEFNFWMGIKT